MIYKTPATKTQRQSTFSSLRLCGLILFLPVTLLSQSLQRPKLAVGIVVDQMRYDYLYRYYSKYSDKGFKRLLNEGFVCENAQYNYVPTYTGPGHASIYTGTTPEYHGIAGNDWYNRALAKSVYCTSDKAVQSVGGSEKAGAMSPVNLLTTTIGDELKLSSNQQSRVIAVSLKDRASILPGGRSANAAYWFDGATGNMISSTWYTKALPEWLNAFNNKHLAEKYLSGTWTTILPIKEYTESTADSVSWEDTYTKTSAPVFPYNLAQINDALIKKGKNKFDLLRATPFGNTYTKEMAIAAIDGEHLGMQQATDMLCISFSSTDYIGHQFGPNSIEAEDTYLRLDKDLGELIDHLDAKIGRKNYVLFLSADHAAAHNPEYMKSLKLQAGVFNEDSCVTAAKSYMNKAYGMDNIIEAEVNQQFYLNLKALEAKGISIADAENKLTTFLENYPGIAKAMASNVLRNAPQTGMLESRMKKGLHAQRSGNVAFAYLPGWIEEHSKGTTHGAGYPYDTHVPLLWLGYTIPKAKLAKEVSITDIAPTICNFLKIQEPNGCIGKVIEEICK